MSTATLKRPSTFAISQDFMGLKPVFFKKDSGALVYQGVPVFRSGTFRDSMGIQNTWDKLHMNQMVTHWNHLRDNNIFKDVPARENHANWILGQIPGAGNVVGWHTNLTTQEIESPVDGKTYSYLLADYEILDPKAVEAIESGLWRNRSSEIGAFTTNDEAEYWPVYMGFAFVDIPAVEGLNFSGQQAGGNPRYVFMSPTNKETGVSDATLPAAASAAAPATAPAAPLLGIPAPAQAFSINGQSVTDVAAVQAHITALEKFQAETKQVNRADFVTSLAKDGKILASQVESLTKFGQSLNDESYAMWVSSFDAAPANSVLAAHGNTTQDTGNGAQAPTETPAEAEINTAKDVVTMLRRAGTSKDKIKASPSFKKLEAAGQAPVL